MPSAIKIPFSKSQHIQNSDFIFTIQIQLQNQTLFQIPIHIEIQIRISIVAGREPPLRLGEGLPRDTHAISCFQCSHCVGRVCMSVVVEFNASRWCVLWAAPRQMRRM